MAAVKIVSCIALTTIFTTCLCLPIKTEKDNNSSEISTDAEKLVLPKEVITNVLKEAFVQVNLDILEVPKVTMSDKDKHKIMRRSKRGVITGGLCPENQWKMPTGECAPCNGGNHPGCPLEDDYNDVNIEK